MAARKPTAKRQPKSKSAGAQDAERETTPNHPANTTTVERTRSTDGTNR
jgi:hypothetical protein